MMNRLPKDRTDCSASTIRARVASVLRQSLEQLFAFACYPSPSVDGLLGTDSGHCEAAVATTRNVINEQTVRKGAA